MRQSTCTMDGRMDGWTRWSGTVGEEARIPDNVVKIRGTDTSYNNNNKKKKAKGQTAAMDRGDREGRNRYVTSE